MGFGAAGICGTAISLTLLPLGFISLVAGVVLPRIEGKFTAGPSGLSADVMAVHMLDRQRYVATGPAVATGQLVNGEPAANRGQAPDRITLGDVWDAIDAAGLRPETAAMGAAYFSLPDGRQLKMPNRSFLDHGIASPELLAVLESWGVRPTASGRYPLPPDHGPDRRVVRPFFTPTGP